MFTLYVLTPSFLPFVAVVSGRPTMYTACMVFADEDYGMARVIVELYTQVYKESLFFLPQFDLKAGKYVLDTTAEVIDKR